MVIFTEWHNGLGISFKVKNILYSKRTPYQQIDIISTSEFGKLLIINNEVQLSERDEYIYHEMLIHPIMISYPFPKNILIIGGGDGGCLREILKYDIESVTLVEIDRTIIDLSKKFFPSLANSFKDKRVKIVNQDGYTFLMNSKDNYDIMVLDTTDPRGIAEKFSSKEFYSIAYSRLNGMLVIQTPNVFLHKEIASKIYYSIKDIFPICRIYFAPIPCLAGLWNFTIGSKKYEPEEVRNKTGVETRFYSIKIHKSIFEFGRIFEKFFKKGHA